MSAYNKIIAGITPAVTQIQHFGAVRNVLLGAGLAYAISEEKYLHTPVIVVFPSIYVGYQSYKNREAIAGFVRTQATKLT
jgi:hypothetical protein